MHPFLASSDFDPFQVAIIVIAVVAGFVKWLWENLQQKGGTTAPPQPDPEEQRLREAAWRKQTGQASAPPPVPPVAAPSPWDELRKAWQELKEAAGQAPARPTPVRTPPPQPQSQRPQQTPRQREPQRQVQPARQQAQPPPRQTQAARVPAVPTVAAAPSPAVETAPAPPPVTAAKAAAPGGSMLTTLRHLRSDPALMRQAILMQEILGPPKALQSSGDFAI